MIPWLLLACAAPSPDDSAGPPSVPAELAQALDLALEQGRGESGAPGATAAVVMADGSLWTGAAGVARVEEQLPMQPGDRLKIGSITKLPVASLVLLLDQQGLWSIDDPVEHWLPEVPHASRGATLRQLLDHTAGYPDYVSQAEVLVDLDREWTPEELLATIADQDLAWEPGTGFSYSNTHYLLLGMALEAATGQDYGVLLRDQVLAPLGLGAMVVPTVDGLPDDLAHGYQGSGSAQVDMTWAVDPTVPWAAGELVADAATVLQLGQGLLVQDHLLDEAHHQAMRTETVLPDGSTTGYGLGLYLDPGERGRSLGHSGSIPGYQSRLRVRETDGTAVAVLVNDFFAEADLVDARLWQELGGW